MRILIGHNHYKIPGGEDAVVQAEYSLLRDFGEQVFLYKRSNREFDSSSVMGKLKYMRTLGWSSETYRDIKALVRRFRPDVAHFHNIFYVITPAAYFACKEEGIPVVQSQHNFRLICSNGLLYRNNKVCEDCLHKSLWQGVYHGCYGNSRVLTAFIAGMLIDHWKKGTWENTVDLYITASQFGRQKLIEGGLPPEKIVVKPNFVYPVPDIQQRQEENYALYVGRLSREKGVHMLLEAWRSIPYCPLKIMGDGPLAGGLKKYAKDHGIKNVDFLGFTSPEEYNRVMNGAKFLLVPSQCYESFPRIIVEAFSYGIPIVASRLGTLAEIVEDEKTGLLFDPADTNDLIAKIHWINQHNEDLLKMGKMARCVFEEKYMARKNFDSLMDIYNRAIELSSGGCKLMETKTA